MPDGMYDNIKPSKSKEEIRKELKLGYEHVIVFLGGMDRHDGVDDLVNALKILRKEIKVKILFAGRGGRKYYRNFRNEIEHSHLKKDVIFTGFVPDRQDILNYVSIADVGVIPFRKRVCTEGLFTFKFFEYIALKVPVVTTTIRTLSNLVKEKKVGEVCEPDNPQSLAKAILTVINNHDKYDLSAEKFLEYHWNNIMERYVDFIEKI
jgi:glycosyltransferase involved in cell wall biosynthesis